MPSGFGKGGCVGAGPAEHDAWIFPGSPELTSTGIGHGRVWHGWVRRRASVMVSTGPSGLVLRRSAAASREGGGLVVEYSAIAVCGAASRRWSRRRGHWGSLSGKE